MIPLTEINRFAEKFKVSAETIEKDYVISWILFCLTKSTLRNNFLFYGGTAIKRIYFEEHRFSEDIDLLSTHTLTLDHLLQELSCLEFAKMKTNLLIRVNQDNIIYTKHRAQLHLYYDGYQEIIGAPKEIRLDFSMNMDLYGKTMTRKVIETYSDLKKQNITLAVMSLNTILANKLGLLIDHTRNEPRDLFDIWFLLFRLEKFDFDLDQVREAFKSKYSFYPTLSTLLRSLNNKSLKKNWVSRLHKQLPEIPDFEMVIQEITDKLTEIFLPTTPHSHKTT